MLREILQEFHRINLWMSFRILLGNYWNPKCVSILNIFRKTGWQLQLRHCLGSGIMEKKLCYNAHPNMAMRRFNSKTFATCKYEAIKNQVLPVLHTRWFWVFRNVWYLKNAENNFITLSVYCSVLWLLSNQKNNQRHPVADSLHWS